MSSARGIEQRVFGVKAQFRGEFLSRGQVGMTTDTKETVIRRNDMFGSYHFVGSADVIGKADKVAGATNGNLAALDATGNLIDSLKKASDFVTANAAITGATKTKITYDSKGLVTAGADLAAGDIPSLDASKITSGAFADARIASAAAWNNKVDKSVNVGAVDFNTLTTSGFYQVTGSTNGPQGVGSTRWNVFVAAGADSIIQMANYYADERSQTVYMRTRDNAGAWSGWSGIGDNASNATADLLKMTNIQTGNLMWYGNWRFNGTTLSYSGSNENTVESTPVDKAQSTSGWALWMSSATGGWPTITGLGSTQNIASGASIVIPPGTAIVGRHTRGGNGTAVTLYALRHNQSNTSQLLQPGDIILCYCITAGVLVLGNGQVIGGDMRLINGKLNDLSKVDIAEVDEYGLSVPSAVGDNIVRRSTGGDIACRRLYQEENSSTVSVGQVMVRESNSNKRVYPTSLANFVDYLADTDTFVQRAGDTMTGALKVPKIIGTGNGPIVEGKWTTFARAGKPNNAIYLVPYSDDINPNTYPLSHRIGASVEAETEQGYNTRIAFCGAIHLQSYNGGWRNMLQGDNRAGIFE